MGISKKALAVAGSVLLGLSGLALAAKGAKSMKKDVIWPAAAVKWEDGPVKGVHVANLWGGIAKGGPYGALLKFDAGLMHPLHWHTKDLKIVVISGTFLHKPEGGTETKLGPGSFLLQAGRSKHVSGCAPGADCEFFMSSSDKFDMTVVESAPAAKK